MLIRNSLIALMGRIFGGLLTLILSYRLKWVGMAYPKTFNLKQSVNSCKMLLESEEINPHLKCKKMEKNIHGHGNSITMNLLNLLKVWKQLEFKNVWLSISQALISLNGVSHTLDL